MTWGNPAPEGQPWDAHFALHFSMDVRSTNNGPTHPMQALPLRAVTANKPVNQCEHVISCGVEPFGSELIDRKKGFLASEHAKKLVWPVF